MKRHISPPVTSRRPSPAASLARALLLCSLALPLFAADECRGGGGGEDDGYASIEVELREGPAQTPEGIALEGAILKTIESAVVAAEVVGVLEEVIVSEGVEVKAGQLLAKIDHEAIRIKLKQLRTQLEMARRKQENDIDRRVAVKNREVAANEYQRALTANARVANTYPLNEIDRLKLIAERAALEVERSVHAIELAGLEVAVAQSEYEQSEELLRRHAVLSPMAGVVVAVEKHRGEWVEPGVELFRIIRTDRLRVEGFVDAAVADGLIGRTAKVQLRRRGETIEVEGKVVFVSPDVNPVNSVARVFLEVDNGDGRLRPGLRVDAVISPR